MLILHLHIVVIIHSSPAVPNGEQRYEVLHGVLWVSFLFVAGESSEMWISASTFACYMHATIDSQPFFSLLH